MKFSGVLCDWISELWKPIPSTQKAVVNIQSKFISLPTSMNFDIWFNGWMLHCFCKDSPKLRRLHINRTKSATMWPWHYHKCQPTTLNQLLRFELAIRRSNQSKQIYKVESKSCRKSPLKSIDISFSFSRLKYITTYPSPVSKYRRPSILASLAHFPLGNNHKCVSKDSLGKSWLSQAQVSFQQHSKWIKSGKLPNTPSHRTSRSELSTV